MSNIKYFTTDKIIKLNLINKIKARSNNRYFYFINSKKYHQFLHVNGYPLDNIQKQVVFSEDKHTIVIAGAGAGKTTTIIGKIKYLIYIKNINPKDILAISFTNESTQSLLKSLSNNGIKNIEVLTFHKLALKFIKPKKIIDESFLDYIISEYFYLNKNTYKNKIIKYARTLTDYKYIKRLIMLCHTNNYTTKDFLNAEKRIIKSVFWRRLKLLSLLYIIMDIYFLYEEEKSSVLSCDFDDLIINATNKIDNISYKYIIVDEYQDTSLIRVRFLQELIKKTNAKLLVVGDDYQSIYRFNGCDINIFLNFKKYFKNPKTFKLQNTYRNSQELINISKKFILKNPYQIKKKITSSKHLNNPIKIVYYNDTNKEIKLKKLISYINDDYLILGRNNFDLNNITNLKLPYLTVHKSKGLEAKNIIIINLENSLYGFPNLVKTSKIEKYLFNQKMPYLYDEERRLFYVALTRTKNYVYLFVKENNSSTFVKELLKDNNIPVLKI